MNLKVTVIILASFLFTQTVCAMSEADEILLETVEHSLLGHMGHDSFSESHDEVSEHQEELTGVSHCIHSHPQITLMFCEMNIQFEPMEIEHIVSLTDFLTPIYYKPPTPPPTS